MTFPASLLGLLQRAGVYDLSQRLLRRGSAPTDFVRDLLRPEPNARILDLGCGTARLLDDLAPTIEYVGCDAEASYINAARLRHGTRARFLLLPIEQLSELDDRDFDIVLAKGLLHHLDDATAGALLATLPALLRPAGSLVTIDPVRLPAQPLVTRGLLAADRGRHIRTEAGYLGLLDRPWTVREHRVLHSRLRVPYHHFFLRAGVGR